MLGRWVLRIAALGALATGAAGSALAALDPVNEYAWMNVPQLPIDCDGPATWFVIALPSAVLLILGGGGLWVTSRSRRSHAMTWIVVGLSLALLGSAVPRLAGEMRRNRAEPVCN